MKFLVAGSLILLASQVALGDTRFVGRLSSKDYLYGTPTSERDSIFDQHKAIDLSAKIGIGSDCGKIDFQATLQNSLQNMLDAKYFASVGNDILAGAPMLAVCYLSPTWCAILKHSQLSANFLSQTRLNQCALIDKFVDSRVEDFYRERQSCVHKAIDSKGGNMDAAMESCRGNALWNQDLSNWAGSGEKVSTNRLLESSAKWAGLTGTEATQVLDRLKALVGDTVVSNGAVSVEFGPHRTPMTPRVLLQTIEKTTFETMCLRLVKRVVELGPRFSISRIVSDADLKELSGGSKAFLIDRSTIQALANLLPGQRDMACRKLSSAVAMTVFAGDLNRSLDVLTTLAQNPNLPPARKQELENKRKVLKEQIEMTIALQRQRSEPLNEVLAKIHEDSAVIQSEAMANDLRNGASSEVNRQRDSTYYDCSDDVFCNR